MRLDMAARPVGCKRLTIQEMRVFDPKGSEYSEIHQAIGLCHHVWGTVESQLHMLFAILCHLPIVQDGILSSMPSHPLLIAFGDLRSFNTRLQMLTTTIANDTTVPPEAKLSWKRLKKDLDKQYMQRNQVSHFILAKQWNGPVGVGNWIAIKLHPFANFADAPEKISSKGLDKVTIDKYASQFSDMQKRIGRFGDYILISRGARPLDADSIGHKTTLLGKNTDSK